MEEVFQRFETLSQAAQRTGISTWTLRRRIATGELRAFVSGRRIIRLRPQDVDGLLSERPNFVRRRHGTG